MIVYRNNDIENISLKNTAVAIGEFDTLHIGHRRIINKAVSNAKAMGLKSLVFMFENNPLDIVLNTKVKPVNSIDKRIEILEGLGVDIVVISKFDKKIMEITKEEFFDNYLIEKFGAKSISVGFNFSFGRKGEGDASYLEKRCEDSSIKLDITPEVTLSDKTVSSTRIRELISTGDVETAAKLLDRYFSISGTIVKGNQIGGKLLGFPTANIEMPENTIVPEYGVYITRAFINGQVYPSITNVGDKPTVGKNYTGVETHIIGSEFGELYGKCIEIEFCEHIRKISSFENADALINQLEKDKDKAIKYFEERRKYE